MDIPQVLSLLDKTAADDRKAVFDVIRGQLRNLSSALKAYEFARSGGQLDAAKEHLAAVRKLLDSANWSPYLWVRRRIPNRRHQEFAIFQSNFAETVAQLEKLSHSPECPPAENAIQSLASIQIAFDGWEEQAVDAKERKRLLLTIASLVFVIATPTFIFFQYWSGEIEIESVSLLFPSDAYSRHSYFDATELSADRPVFDLPDRKAFMTEFTRFYFGHSNNFLEEHFEALPPGKPEKPKPPFRSPVSPAPTAAPAPTPEAAPAPPPAPPTEPKASLQKSARAIFTSLQVPPVALQVDPQMAGPQPPFKAKQFTPHGLQEHMPIRWKVQLMNKSLRTPKFVSEVRETIELIKETPFPWAELDASPNLTFRSIGKRKKTSSFRGKNDVLELINDGLGPAVGLEWEFKSSKGSIVNEGRHFFLSGKTIGMAPLVDGKEWISVRVEKDSKEVHLLNEGCGIPILRLSKLPSGVGEDEIETSPENWLKNLGTASPLKRFRKIEGGGYEERITTAKRLSEVTEIESDKLAISLSFEDIKGDKQEIVKDVRLPEDVLLYLRNKNFVGAPCAAAPAGSAMADLYYAIANTLTPPDIEKTNRDILTAVFDFELSHLEPGRRVTKSQLFDAKLSPLGHVSVVTTARGIRTGTYQLSVDVCGEEKVKFEVNLVKPELREFPKSYDSSDVAKTSGRLLQERVFEISWYRDRIGRDGYLDSRDFARNDLDIFVLGNYDRNVGEYLEWSFAYQGPQMAPGPNEAAPAAAAPAVKEVPVPPKEEAAPAPKA